MGESFIGHLECRGVCVCARVCLPWMQVLVVEQAVSHNVLDATRSGLRGVKTQFAQELIVASQLIFILGLEGNHESLCSERSLVRKTTCLRAEFNE